MAFRQIVMRKYLNDSLMRIDLRVTDYDRTFNSLNIDYKWKLNILVLYHVR